MVPRAGVLALALALGLVAVMVGALSTGVLYLPPSVSLKASWEKTILQDYAVSVNANSTYTIDISQYTSGIASIEAVKVIVRDASATATIKALDANGNVLAQADIVPLSGGYVVTFPGNTANITIENLATSVWNGTITVVVQSSIDVKLVFQQTQVTVVGGQALVPATIEVYSLPASGSVSLTVDRVDFSVAFEDPSDVDGDGKTVGDSFIYLQAYSGSTPQTYDVQVKITTSAGPGTYTIKITMWFHEGVKLEGDPNDNPVAIGDMSLTAVLTDGSTTATASPGIIEDIKSRGWVKYAIVGLAGIIIGMLFLGGRR